MRLPANPDNWTAKHATRAIDYAWKLFDEYERKVNFDLPESEINELHRPYMNAREQALLVSKHVEYYEAEAKRLP